MSKVMKKWHGKDVSLGPLQELHIAVIGYGNQGRAQSNNLKKSKLKITVGLRDNSPNWKKAEEDGHNVTTISEAVRCADIIHILTSDLAHKEIYNEIIEPTLDKGKTLSFSHGASIYWKWIIPVKNIDIILVSPKTTLAYDLERGYDKRSIGLAISVDKDYSGKALGKALAMGKGIGGKNAIMFRTTFKEETIVNWFAEQVVLCGGMPFMIINAFETLVEAGYQPEIVYFEVLHKLKATLNLILCRGISGMFRNINKTARYGGLTNGPRVIDTNFKKRTKLILHQITNGIFATEVVKRHNDSQELFKKIELHVIEKTMQKEMHSKNREINSQLIVKQFVERTVLYGGMPFMIINAFETLVEAGYQPEIVYFEVLYELKFIIEIIQKYGISGMYKRVSEIARYGGLTRGPKINKDTKVVMKKTLSFIKNNKLKKEYIVNNYSKNNLEFVLNQRIKDLASLQIESTGKTIRGLMLCENIVKEIE